jgi:hypothetical protein
MSAMPPVVSNKIAVAIIAAGVIFYACFIEVIHVLDRYTAWDVIDSRNKIIVLSLFALAPLGTMLLEQLMLRGRGIFPGSRR